MAQHCQRAGKRFRTQLVVSIRTHEHDAGYGETRDISAGGLYFYTNSDLSGTHSLRLVLPLPPELRESGRNWVICNAEIVRIERQPDGRLGVGAQLKRYEILSEHGGEVR
jgi:L-alanine-DL-glutamate epimerase-like enolase superfamily enzyme